MLGHVGGRHHLRGDLHEVGVAARLFELRGLLQGVGDGDEIDGRVLFEQAGHRLEDHLVLFQVEVLGLEDLQGFAQGFGVQEQGADDVLFHFDGLGRHAEAAGARFPAAAVAIEPIATLAEFALAEIGSELVHGRAWASAIRRCSHCKSSQALRLRASFRSKSSG